jgi:DNA repair exonuclease SbcCD nuclease subunit
MHGSDVEKFNKCDSVLCGDIHKRQVLNTKSGVSVVYPGSMIQQNFGETVSEHGFNVVTINEKDVKFEFFDIENPVKYLNFRITDIEDIEEGKEELLNA